MLYSHSVRYQSRTPVRSVQCLYVLGRSHWQRAVRELPPELWHTDAVNVVLLADELLRCNHEPIEAHDNAERRRATHREAPGQHINIRDRHDSGDR